MAKPDWGELQKRSCLITLLLAYPLRNGARHII